MGLALRQGGCCSQVQKVNDIPIGLEVAVGICCCISPIMLVIAYFIEKKKAH